MKKREKEGDSAGKEMRKGNDKENGEKGREERKKRTRRKCEKKESKTVIMKKKNEMGER